MDNEFIFVYGSLRRQTATALSQLLARHCTYLANGSMQGSLYEVDGYPGAIASAEPGERVFGELYRIIDREFLLRELDAYEECTQDFPQPHEYVRKKVLVSRESGGPVLAWVYLYNRDVSHLAQIRSGDYLAAD
jgi:gamma-glutamylcyclotransferase (GGCT)/AIG2-like uncharacterized protein YtfP